MRLFVYDMLVNVSVIYYVHVCEQARWARSAGNSAIENLCIIIIIKIQPISVAVAIVTVCVCVCVRTLMHARAHACTAGSLFWCALVLCFVVGYVLHFGETAHQEIHIIISIT